MIEIIDGFLNRFTMYRLTVYYLIGLVCVAALLSFLHLLNYNPLDIFISTGTAVIFSYTTNKILAKFFGAVTNSESALITALILTLIVPVKFPHNIAFIAAAAVVAMGSKYFVTIEKRHIFNPAAVAVAGISLLSPEHTATWWVGTPTMLPFVIIGGLLLVRKIQRGSLVFHFLIVYFLILAIGSISHSSSLTTVISTLQLSIYNSAVFFFAFVMLTEPLTSPTTQKLRNWYGYIVAVFYATTALHLPSFLSFTPEAALCIGNVFSYIVSPKYRLILPLSWRKDFGGNTSVFAFPKPEKFLFTPGQYMEWTLPHPHTDSRGNRRYFSIASSPTEQELLLTVKFYQPSSSYKKALFSMQKGQEIIAASLAGDFVLPADLSQRLVFIAGGVGIAPFHSMIKYLADTNQQTNIILLYANRKADEILFTDVWEKAKKIGVKTVYTLTDATSLPSGWSQEAGHITPEMIKRTIPDFLSRRFYVSGPQLMVESVTALLREMHIAKNMIRTDFFPGYTEKKI